MLDIICHCGGNPALQLHNQRKGPPCREQAGLNENGAGTQTRTADLRITNALLYQLSYSGTGTACEGPKYRPRPGRGQWPAASGAVTYSHDHLDILRLGACGQIG